MKLKKQKKNSSQTELKPSQIKKPSQTLYFTP